MPNLPGFGAGSAYAPNFSATGVYGGAAPNTPVPSTSAAVTTAAPKPTTTIKPTQYAPGFSPTQGMAGGGASVGAGIGGGAQAPYDPLHGGQAWQAPQPTAPTRRPSVQQMAPPQQMQPTGGTDFTALTKTLDAQAKQFTSAQQQASSTYASAQAQYGRSSAQPATTVNESYPINTPAQSAPSSSQLPQQQQMGTPWLSEGWDYGARGGAGGATMGRRTPPQMMAPPLSGRVY